MFLASLANGDFWLALSWPWRTAELVASCGDEGVVVARDDQPAGGSSLSRMRWIYHPRFPAAL